MSTLLLRLSAPLQSWGSESKFERRTTQREPTKSGVIGMLAAALGRTRNESISDLAMLKFGVRIDQPGQLVHDFHTAEHTADKPPYITSRYYLADAVFLVGLEGDKTLLYQLDAAIRAPVFPLFLGRRSCPPVGRISLGVREKLLENALYDEPWQASYWYRKRMTDWRSQLRPMHLTVVLGSSELGAARRRDEPFSFSQSHRKHNYRYVTDNPKAVAIADVSITHITEHDAYSELEG